jgi:hypothetical protein
MQRLEKLMELLKTNQKYHVTYKKNIANHLSMDLIALYFLNASTDELENTYDKYTRVLEPVVHSDFAITGINWKNNLGSGQYYWSYYKFFRAKKSILGLEQVLRDYLPHLTHGISAGLFNPLIRLAYALDLWNYAGVQNNQQLNSIAEEESIIALAYFADSYTELPINNPQNKRIEKSPENFSTLTHKMSQLYIKHQDIILLNHLTALHALRLIADFLPKDYSLSDYWNSFMANYSSKDKILTKHNTPIMSNAPDEIQEKLYLIKDSSQIKLLNTAVQELEFYNDENYLKIINLVLPD